MEVKIKIKKGFDPNKINIKKNINTECNIWANNVVNKIKLDISGSKLNVRSGKLRNDVGYKIKQTNTKTIIEIGSRKIPYSKIHDDKKQTIIQPASRRFLSVPVNQTIKGRARQYPNTFVKKSRKGNLIVFKRTKKGFIPLFVLRKTVNLKGTGYITDNINDRLPLLKQSILLRLNSIKV